jgi:hypothetical protein
VSSWSDTLTAIWAALDADETLTDLLAGGTKYKFQSGGLLKRLAIERALCPILGLGPASDGSQLRPARRRRGGDREDRFALQLEIATSSIDAAPVLVLLDTFHKCIEANIGNGFGLADAGPHEIEFQGPKFDLVPDEKGPIPFWTCSVVCICRYRIG